MSSRRAVVLILLCFTFAQAVTARLEDTFIDSIPDIPAVSHNDLFRRLVNYTTECLPSVKRASLPSDCSGLTSCDAWCCETNQDCCTGSGGGCMPKGADNCGGRGYCDDGMLCCGLSTGNCYPPESGTCCGSNGGIWCPFGTDCHCPITGCSCTVNSTSAATSSAGIAVSVSEGSGSSSKSTSTPMNTGLSVTVQATTTTSSHSSSTVSTPSVSQIHSTANTNGTSPTLSSSGGSTSNEGSTSVALDCIRSSQLSFVFFVAYLIFV